MDISTIIGVAGSFLLLIGAILAGHDGHAGDIRAFIDVVGLVIVVGGSFLTVCTCVPLSNVLGLAKVCLKTVFVGNHSHEHVVHQIVDFATIARRDGILALESKMDAHVDPFLATGIRMVVDGSAIENVERALNAEIDSTVARHQEGKMALDAMGMYGPAYGMIATLIGLVLMLGNLDDPDAIGPGMAVALLGTAYGCVVSNVVFLPLGTKLSLYSHREKHSKQMVLEGIRAIQAGDNPRIVEQKLKAFLSPAERARLDAAGGKGGKHDG